MFMGLIQGTQTWGIVPQALIVEYITRTEKIDMVEHPYAIHTMTLPCGNPGIKWPEDSGYICQKCLTVFGNIECPCTDKHEEKKNDAI